MTERAELMRIYRSNGISSISLMRDHYNKYDDGGDIQPSDATFRATLTNPVNSYRSNAPAGIGDAAITKATGLLNPITAATLTAAPLGAISKINAAAKAYKAAKIANPIIASTIGASSTSTGLAGYLDSRPDKKLSRDIEDKNYVGVASDLVEGVTEGLTAISPLRVIDTKGVKKITRPLKKQLTRILRPGDIKVGDNKLSSREAAIRYLNNIDQYNVPYNSSNKEAFKIAPELEDYLIETKQSFSPEVVDKFIQRQGRMLRGVKASSPEEAITYFTNPSPKGFETTRGPGIYTSNSTDIAKQFSNRGYIGDLSLDFGIASNESPLEKLKRYKKALPQVDNAVSPASLETTRLMWSLREGDINQKEFINKARNTFGYKGIEGTYYYNSIPPRSERVLYESPKVNKVYEASTFNQTLPVKESDLFITQRGEGSVPYIFKRLQKENPSAVGEAIQQLTTLEQSRRDRIQEAARYYQNIQDRAKIGATVAGAGLGAYGIYKAIDSKKAFGGNIYDGKGTKSNQMNVSFPLKANTKDPSQIQIEQYLYRPPNYDTAKTYTPLYNDKFKNTQDQIDILNALKTTSRRPNRLQNERSWNRFQDRLNVTDSLGWSKVQASAIISRDGFETNFVEDTIQPGGDHAKGALQVHGDREKDMRSRGYNPLSFRDAYKYVDEVIKTDKTFNTHGGKYISGDSMRSMWNNPNVTPEALNKAFIQWFSRSGKPFYKENSEAAKSVYNYILKFNRDEKALIR